MCDGCRCGHNRFTAVGKNHYVRSRFLPEIVKTAAARSGRCELQAKGKDAIVGTCHCSSDEKEHKHAHYKKWIVVSTLLWLLEIGYYTN